VQKRESGALERAVLLALSAASEPMSVAQVQSQLPGSPAYTTVMTTLSRLTRKGAPATPRCPSSPRCSRGCSTPTGTPISCCSTPARPLPASPSP